MTTPRNPPAPPPVDVHQQRTLAMTGHAVAAELPALLSQAVRLAWRTDRRAVLAVAAGQTVAAAATAVALLATAAALTHLLQDRPWRASADAAWPTVLLLLLTLAARYAAASAARMAAARIGPRCVTEASYAVVEGANKLELAAYEEPDVADALEAAEDGAQAMADLVTDAQGVIASLAQMAAAVSVLVTLHPLLLPLVVLTAVPKAAATIRAARIEHMVRHETHPDRRLRYYLYRETTKRRPAAEIRAAKMAHFLQGRFREVSRRLDAAVLAGVHRAERARILGDAGSGAAQLATWTALGALAATGRVEPAAAGAAVLAVRTVNAALADAASTAGRLFRSALYVGDWNRWTALAEQHTARRGTRAVPATGPAVIEAQDVTYTYPGAARPALDGVTVSVRRGEVVALVGENGAGKSTLIQLLTGLTIPDTGTMRWDGRDLADADPATVWEHVALVPQRFTEWPLSARENIQLGTPRPGGDHAVHAAAATASADSVIARLPHGLDTSLAPSWADGHDLSGGQWQRIALARAFHKDAALLVLDEPTSALDSRAEAALFATMRQMAADRATILVTHRLISTRHADRIIVLHHGRVAEQGTFAELLALPGGIFRELLALQEGDRPTEPALAAVLPARAAVDRGRPSAP
ncbi:ATP-binding cassette domain-containing protein [Streptomyces sp. JNUCC 64]